MERLSIVQLGKGTIGATLIDQVRDRRAALRDHLGVDLVYAGIIGRRSGRFDAAGLDLTRWRDDLPAVGFDGGSLVREALRSVDGGAVLVDATAEEGMAGLYVEALNAGFHVVSCNKKPLAGPLDEYRRVKEAARRQRRHWLYEVTVGAGLPVIGTLKDLLESGDRLESIEGCFSGTLNYLCASLDAGERFSQVLARARELGYTEPDPRDDLGGTDVARKGLILAREAGLEVEPDQVRLEPFCAIDRGCDTSVFLSRTRDLDDEMTGRWKKAAAKGGRPRYVASIDGACSTALREVPAESALGRLSGPENIFVFRTKRYADRPLVVSGPGAGPSVTAAGAFADILKVARAMHGRPGSGR